jgi:chaperonin GroEL
MIRKVKTSPKMFKSNQVELESIVLKTMNRISEIVGATYGPGGKNVLIESDYPGIPNKNTKDGVTVFNSLGASNSYEHLIIEQARDAAKRTATEAGDGTTTATILSASLVENLYAFTKSEKRYSPQKAAREMNKIIRDVLVPAIQKKAIKIDSENIELLKMVATISANGDKDMADAVIKAFELIGYGDSSHVTIKELSGPYGYDVSVIEGFPVPMGYEESIGKFHPAFINDQSNQRCVLDKPLFLLFDGHLSDLVMVKDVLERIGENYANGNSDLKNVVIFAHGYGDSILTQLALNFPNPNSINVVPMVTPRDQFINAELQFLMDVSAFTGAKIFGLKDPISQALVEDLGKGMSLFESYRFRSTIVGDSDPLNIEVRADELKTQKENAESVIEERWITERLGKLTTGIAKLTIYGGSNGELKEAHDRAEDAVCAVRSAISKGAVQGGCRVYIDLAMYLEEHYPDNKVVKQVLIPSLLAPIARLLDNAGYSEDEATEIIDKLVNNPDIVYDVENQVFGNALELGVLDAAPAVEEALKNAGSIATVMGTIGGIVAFPRDDQFERSEASADRDFENVVNSPELYTNEANNRP